MEEEIWKDVVGYEALYQVSNLGRVKSLKLGREKILKFGIDLRGYPMVCLHKNGYSKTIKVHRLVAIAFLDNKENFPQVNHKDEVKLNNRVNNLEWCTRSYNINYGTRNDKFSKQVIQLLDGKEIATFSSVREVKRKLGYAFQAISKCCRNENKSAYGYNWKFKDEEKNYEC